MYFQKSFDIVGYTFNGNNYCPEDMKLIALTVLVGDNQSIAPETTTEDVLKEWSTRLGIDPTNEHSYDSSQFPKVIFRDQLDDEEISDVCGTCQNPLGDQ